MQLDALRASGLEALPLKSLLGRAGSLAITFDDGYKDFADVALPLLTEFRIPATVFVVSGYCGRSNDWRSPGLPRLELMDWADIREVARAGVTIGAHTINHPDLTALQPKEAIEEMRGCRMAIEDHIGLPVDTFAYPYGKLSQEVRRMAAEVFPIACGTELGFVGPASHPHSLPRIDAGYLRRRFWMSRLNTGLGSAYIALQRRRARLT